MPRSHLQRSVPVIRRIHLYLGLFLLAEVWIFAVSGLLLNHPRWEVSQFWSRRGTVTRSYPLPDLSSSGGQERAFELMQHLGIKGELESISWSPDADGFQFNVVRPARILNISVDLAGKAIEVEEVSTDFFGFLDILHKFNGVDFENGGRNRDWIVTSFWTLIMDLLSLSLILWVSSGVLLWVANHRERRAGGVAIASGLLLALAFIFGPFWVF